MVSPQTDIEAKDLFCRSFCLHNGYVLRLQLPETLESAAKLFRQLVRIMFSKEPQGQRGHLHSLLNAILHRGECANGTVEPFPDMIGSSLRPHDHMITGFAVPTDLSKC